MLTQLLEQAWTARAPYVATAHDPAFRLFDGFTEGAPGLVVDVYASTAVVHDHGVVRAQVDEAIAFLAARVTWLRSIVAKTRAGATSRERNGLVVWGSEPDRRIREHGVAYAVDLTLNRDCSFYLDTRELRAWALANLAGKRVLNTFAYTCSLGVAARAGGATRVVNADLNARFMALGRASYALNGFDATAGEFVAADFFPLVARLKRERQRFDCVFLDPPFFSVTERGRVDLAQRTTRLINKVRPLVDDGGALVIVNNALFVPGTDFVRELESLCADGYLRIEQRVDVGRDCVGTGPRTGGAAAPAPFNHPTKIAVLRVRRREG